MIKDWAFSHKQSFFHRIGHSIFAGWRQTETERDTYRRWLNTLVLHFRPRTVPERTLQFTLSWGLGGMAAVLTLLLFSTGILLKFYYEPFPGNAYESIVFLQHQVPFGKLIRNIHHWSGHGLLIIAFLHFLRVFFTGAFYLPRQFNWIIGLALFLTVLSSNLTGYLLPWDQLAYWAITISTGMLEYIPYVGMWLKNWVQGGSEMGSATLTNFYAIHTAVLPALLIILIPFHFWRVRKAGGLVIPRKSTDPPADRGKTVEAMPNLILRELVVSLVLIAAILITAVCFDAPLESKANPGLSPNPTKAPWYFAGLQELLMHFHPMIALCIIPAMTFLLLLSVPYWKYQTNPAGIWFRSFRGRKMSLIASITGLVLACLWVLSNEYTHRFQATPASTSGGLISFVVIFFVVIVFTLLIKKKFNADRHETIQAVFVLLLCLFLLLMLINIWFRGPGMQLMWPWQAAIKVI